MGVEIFGVQRFGFWCGGSNAFIDAFWMLVFFGERWRIMEVVQSKENKY
jgi:hypothetical protein